MQEMETRYRDDFCQRCGEISCTLNFDEALKTILDNVERCLDIQASSIHLADPASQTASVVAARNLSKEYAYQPPIRLEDSPVEREALKGKTITIADARENPAYRKLAESEGVRSILCAPLKSKERIIGSLWLFTREVRQFDPGEISYVTTLAGQAGVVLNNAKLYQSLHALSEVGKAITSRLNLEEVLQMIVEKATQLMGGKGASILLIARQEETMEVSATYGLSERFLRKGPVHVEKSLRDCLDRQMVIPDVSKSPDVQYPERLAEEGIRSILCTPLTVRGRSIGTLRVYMIHPREFSVEDLQLFQILSDFGGIAIENARLYNHIKRDYEDLTQDVWQWYDWGKRAPNI
ncbi:MAG: GAF domain-containing protein [bacterium]